MWWILLFLLMLVIAALLWWRGRQEREWQLELAYLTRHQKEDEHAAAPAADAQSLQPIPPVLTNMRDQVQNQRHHQVLSERLVAQIQTQHPRLKPSQALSDEEKQRLSSEAVLADLPIFAHSFNQIETTVPVASADTNQAAPPSDNLDAAASPSSTNMPDIPAFAPILADTMVSAADGTATAQPAEMNSPASNADSHANTRTVSVDVGNPEAGSHEHVHQVDVGVSHAPDAHLEVITLAEATRKVATLVKPAATAPQQVPLETVRLNWPLPTPPLSSDAAKPGVEITLSDPALSRIRARTEAEREALRAAQTGPAEVVTAPIRHAHEQDNVEIIGEEDIRSNLLRQRLARRRTEHPDRVTSQSDRPVIAEDEVLANLAKTDSPVNKHKFRRTTVRESVIPAAARIGQSHAVNVSPVAAAFSQAGLPTTSAVLNAPISTRFTPFSHPLAANPALGAAAVMLSPETGSAGLHAVSAHNGHMAEQGSALPDLQTRAQWSDDGRLPQPILSMAEDMAGKETDVVHGGASAAPSFSQLSWSESPVQQDMPTDEGDDSLTDWVLDVPQTSAEDDIPEWQKTLDEAMAQPQPDWVSGWQRRNGIEPITVGHSTESVTPRRSNTLADANPSADFVPPPQPAAVHTPHTAMGMALQTALHNAPTAQPGSDMQPPLPQLDLLLPPQHDPSAHQSEEALLENGITIEEKLAEFKVKVNVVDAYAGPVITRYEIEPAQGVRGSQVVNLEKDLARSLGFASIRVVETIPGKTCMGLELPNPKRQIIRLREVFNAPVFQQPRSKLTLALGQDITGQPVVTDLAKAPHLLVAGTTGSGKSVGVNAMILSMLFKATPEEVRLIMIDPKMLELSIYEGIPHLLAPVVTDMKLAANALTWCVNEMEKRYRLMSHMGVRNLAGFNQKVVEATSRGQKLVNPFSLTPDDPEVLEKLPYIVVVVDEFADLMMTAGKKIEELIARLAQKARAAGIHLILATQRPSVDVITGLIKANIPTRIAFQVSSKVDSRTILDQMGAENLLGQGDMLFLPPGTGYPQRVHGAFVADEEVHRVVDYLKQFGEPHYIDDILTAGVSEDDLFSNANGGRNNEGDQDSLYDEAVALVVKTRKASISSVQRQLRIGYNRAARLVEQMEADGIVSAAEGNGNRTVLAPNGSHLDE